MRRLLLLLGLFPNLSPAAIVERRAWLFEQMGTSTFSTGPQQARYQLGVTAYHYQDVISPQVTALLDLRYFEVGVKASRRFSVGTGGQSAELATTLNEDRNIVSLEIARYYLSSLRHFGRLGVEFFETFPGRLHWVRFNVQTGALAREGNPWGYKLLGQFFWSLSGRSPFVLLRTELERMITTPLSVGGVVSFSYRPNHNPVSATQFEYVSFTVGPYMKWQNDFFTLQGEFSARCWIDRERVATSGGDVLESPSEIQPNLSIRAWIPFG